MGFVDGLKAALRALPQPALLAAPLQGWYCCWYYCCYCFGTAFAFAAFAAAAAAAFAAFAAFAAAAAAAAAAAGTGGSGCGGDDFRGGGGGCSGGGSGIGGAAVVGAAHTRRPLRVGPPHGYSGVPSARAPHAPGTMRDSAAPAAWRPTSEVAIVLAVPAIARKKPLHCWQLARRHGHGVGRTCRGRLRARHGGACVAGGG